MSIADRVRAARDFDQQGFLPFRVAGSHCGWIRPAFARQLARWPAIFSVTADSVALADVLDSPAERSAALGPVLQALRDEGLVSGWRDESYPVAADFGAPPLLTIERAAAHSFGIRTRAAHLNGYVGRGEECKMWIARRAATKQIEPLMLDTMVGGGISVGFTPQQTLLKECGEEAGIAMELARRAKQSSKLLSLHEVSDGAHWEMLDVFDLELDAEFTPQNHDGEVAEFQMLPISEVRRLVRDTSEFTVDAALVIVDFLLRHDLSAAATA